jgi:hypothetical protein
MDEDLSTFDKLLGNEGLKVDVTANLSPDIYAKLFITIAGSIIISSFAVTLIKNVMAKK